MFYHKARFDCLERRVETPMDMTEHYVARDDFLNYCYVKYIGAPLKYGHIDTTPRPADVNQQLMSFQNIITLCIALH